jgi:predicted phage-related endonuclease
MTPAVKVHPVLSMLSASLDGLEIEGACAVEIKAPGKVDHELALKGIVPEKYIPQLQHIMEVCQLDEMYYMSYISDLDYTIFKVQKDYDYTARLLQAELDFWQRVQDRNPPQPTDRDIIEIKSEAWTHYSDQYAALYVKKKDLQNQLASIELEEESIKSELIHLANQQSAQGAGIRLTKSLRRGHIDYARIPQIQGIDLEPFRKPSTESWRISIQGVEE